MVKGRFACRRDLDRHHRALALGTPEPQHAPVIADTHPSGGMAGRVKIKLVLGPVLAVTPPKRLIELRLGQHKGVRVPALEVVLKGRGVVADARGVGV